MSGESGSPFPFLSFLPLRPLGTGADKPVQQRNGVQTWPAHLRPAQCFVETPTRVVLVDPGFTIFSGRYQVPNEALDLFITLVVPQAVQ